MLDVKFESFPRIETARLVMREIVPEDGEVFFRLRTHPQVTMYLDREDEKDIAAVLTVIEKIRKSFDAGDGIAWGLCFPNDPTLIGTMSIWRIDKANHRGEVGYSLFPEFWQRGYASEALEAAILFAFQHIKLHSLEANTSVHNSASHALLQKFGFVKEAHFKENWYYKGNFYDSVIFSLLNRKES